MSTDDLEELQRIDKAGALVMSARVALRRWQKDEARGLLQQALKLNPSDIGALELTGDLFMSQGEQEKALKVFERGRQLHPQHAAFEEKIALCYLDLEEMRREQERKKALEAGQIEIDPKGLWLDKVPSKAFGLSLLVPGAGQIYNEETPRGVLLLGAWLVSCGLWYLPVFIGYRSLPESEPATFFKALGAVGGFWQGWFWLFLTLFFLVYIVAAADAWRGAERANEARRQGHGEW